MAEKLKRAGHRWSFVTAAPPREVFAVMEQMTGTPPYRFEVLGADAARVVEHERKSLLFGHWVDLAARDREGRQRTGDDGAPRWRRPVRWVQVTASEADNGTRVTVTASRGKFTDARAIQLVQLLTRGVNDRRTVYRDRRVPDGPVTLVASWAGMPYRLYTEPDRGAARGPGVITATHLVAIGNVGAFVRVRLDDGTVGYIERDQLVPAPSEATRAAQVRTAVRG